MLTGIELAGLILAIFPVVIKAVEHYEEGFQQIGEWVRFRGEFATFLNTLNRQKIFFRQNIEELLSPIVASEYEMSQLLDNPKGDAWMDEGLEENLRKRLPGKHEYECYISTVSAVLELLEELKQKLKIVDGQPHWIETASSRKIKWRYEFRRITYTFGTRRRDKLMNQLEKHNQSIQTLLGNSERLDPMRRKRKSPIPKYFQLIRSQASSLHTALTRAWHCDCSPAHAAKFLLEKRVKFDKMGVPEIQHSSSIKFKVFFYPEPWSWPSSVAPVQTEAQWCATEIAMLESNPDPRREFPRGADSDARKVSFFSGGPKSATPSMLSDALEITNLCDVLKQGPGTQKSLGYLRDGPDRLHAVDLAANPQLLLSSDMHRVLNLESLLVGSTDVINKSEKDAIVLPRRTRLSIAVILANSLLQLHTGPWLPETWGKRDIFFFQSRDGTIHARHPFLLSNFRSNSNYTSSPEHDLPKPSRGRPLSYSCSSSLLSLGIVILELWFNQTIESRPFRSAFLGPDGKENEYTDFNTAQKWQEQTLEEAGLDLHNLTRRCIYCAFGPVSQDLGDDEFRRAVYGEVVQPLERLLGRFEDALV